MKKIVLILAFILSVGVVFAGCDNNNEDFWSATTTNLQTLFESENYGLVKDITFNEQINTISQQGYGQLYKDLTEVYAVTFNASIFLAENYKSAFMLNPVNKTNRLRDKIKDINKNIDSLNNQISIFLTEKNRYEITVNSTEESIVQSLTEQSRLIDFKQHYLNLIEKAYNLSVSVNEAYSEGYYNIDSYTVSVSDEQVNKSYAQLALNFVNLNQCNMAIKTLNFFNAKTTSVNTNYVQTCINYFKNILTPYMQDELSLAENFNNKFVAWREVFYDFNSESVLVVDIMNNLNLITLQQSNMNAQDYAERTNNPEDKIKVQLFLDFYKSAEILKSYTTALVVIQN